MKYHVMALLTTVIWGTTLVSSKVLLSAGMLPAEILFCRMILAYCLLWVLYPRTHRVRSWHDELIFAVAGLFGGTIYFLTENTALVYTQATNVSLICATVPLVTALFSFIILKESCLSRRFISGSVIAFLGVALVIFNGTFVLKLSPLGDTLALASVTSWSLYCVILKKLRAKYNLLFITRNVFFYSIITLLPYFIYEPFSFNLSGFLRPVVISNLLFLGFIASSFCFLMWTIAIKNIGVVATNNYIYFMPLVTILTAAIVLAERITIFAIIGSVFIIGGLCITNARIFKSNS